MMDPEDMENFLYELDKRMVFVEGDNKLIAAGIDRLHPLLQRCFIKLAEIHKDIATVPGLKDHKELQTKFYNIKHTMNEALKILGDRHE